MKKKMTRYLTLIVLIIPVFVLQAKLNIDSKYFRQLMFRESPFAPSKGIYPISAEQTQKSAHYKFDF